MGISNERNFDFLEQEFELPGSIISISSLGSGHIHDTYLVTCQDPGSSKFVLQKFNHLVFVQPEQVAANIRLVYRHFQASKDATSLVPLELFETKSGQPLYKSSQGDYWRLFNYIDRSDSYDQVYHRDQALGGAIAFGSFIQALHELDPGDLFTTIPDFHSLKHRFKQLTEAVSEDRVNRVDQYRSEVEFALKRESMVLHLTELAEADEIPTRVTHNDTKINNVLFRKDTTEAISVIDLDTVMPGLLLYDFGDMARTFCNNALEEESAQKAFFRMNMFEALCEGFFQGIKFRLSRAEIDSLKSGPWWMTYIMGIRFLADFINGDIYYKISYELQNLDRARNQFSLLSDIEKKQTQIDQMVDTYYR